MLQSSLPLLVYIWIIYIYIYIENKSKQEHSSREHWPEVTPQTARGSHGYAGSRDHWAGFGLRNGYYGIQKEERNTRRMDSLKNKCLWQMSKTNGDMREGIKDVVVKSTENSKIRKVGKEWSWDNTMISDLNVKVDSGVFLSLSPRPPPFLNKSNEK